MTRRQLRLRETVPLPGLLHSTTGTSRQSVLCSENAASLSVFLIMDKMNPSMCNPTQMACACKPYVFWRLRRLLPMICGFVSAVNASGCFLVLPGFLWAGRSLQLHQQRQKTRDFEQIHLIKFVEPRGLIQAWLSLERRASAVRPSAP